MSAVVAIPFHTIWLGNTPPLRVLENLGHLLQLQPTTTIPLIWLDQTAWEGLLQRAPLPVQACNPAALPAVCRDRARTLALPPSTTTHWLEIELPGATHHLQVLLLHELTAELEQPWLQVQPALNTLNGLATNPAAGPFLQQELGLADPAAKALLNGHALIRYMQTLLNHACQHWAAHGLLCLASDLLRMLALAWRPGAYGDLGDLAARLHSLPSAGEAGLHGFWAHHTVAVENDLIVATNRTILQAITLATALWSWRCVRAIAARLGITRPNASPHEQLQAVLPYLDQRLPARPSLPALFQPPFTRLADYINLAYGAPPQFHPAAALSAYTAGRRGKELLINDVGGFTGYQKAAHHLLPNNASGAEAFVAANALRSYAPQLGWRTYGFGSIDRLIDLGQRLRNPTTTAAGASATRADLALIADSLGLATARLETMAVLCHRLHGLLSQAHVNPQQRATCLAQVVQLCQQAEHTC